jgi:hypothetical protein
MPKASMMIIASGASPRTLRARAGAMEALPRFDGKKPVCS